MRPTFIKRSKGGNYLHISKPLMWDGKQWVLAPIRGVTYRANMKAIKQHAWDVKMAVRKARRALKKTRTTAGKTPMTVT